MSTSRRLVRTVTAVLAITAIATPPASALPVEMTQGSPTSPPARVIGPVPAPTVTRTFHEGFDWGSGAIGAGGTAAVLLLAGARTSAMSRRRHSVADVR